MEEITETGKKSTRNCQWCYLMAALTWVLRYFLNLCNSWASLVAQLVKKSARNAGDPGSIPGLGRSPGEGEGYPLQYSGLEHSMDCIVHGVEKSQTCEQFSLHFTCDSHLP